MKQTLEKYSKIHFTNGEQEALRDTQELEQILREEYEMIPENFTILGKPGETGLAVVSNGTLVSAIKHPKTIAQSFDPVTNIAEFGGNQTLGQLETSMAVPYGKEYSAMRASQVLFNIKKNGLVDTTRKTGFGSTGMEEEAMHFDSEGNPFELPADEQIETQNNTKEVALQPTDNMFDQAITVARSRINEALLRPENIVPSFSFSILSKPEELKKNSGEMAPYVNAVITRMYDEYFYAKEGSPVQDYWNNIAKESGYDDFNDLRGDVDSMAPWAVCAAHVSLGLRTEKINGSYEVGLEEGIAVADMIHSNFGTLLEWMTYSTPLAYQEHVGAEIDGEMRYPRDSRSIAKLITRTGYPGEFIKTPEAYNSRAIHALITGAADRIDRGGYITYQGDLDDEFASAHGRVRLRISGGSGKEKFSKPMGRVEFTGGGETPDLEAMFARNAMLKLMGIASYEAVAHGQHPMEYFANKFPSMATDKDQFEVSQSYNFFGKDNPKAASLIEEGRVFLDYMEEEYGHEEIQYLTNLARIGLNKLTEETEARTYQEYLNNSKGNISDVMKNMYDDGYTALEIAKAAADFELKQSMRLIELGGDVLALGSRV